MSRIYRLIAIAAITLFVAPLAYFTIGVASHVAREKKGTPRVMLIGGAKLITSINQNGDRVQSALISWENTGDCPVRMLVVNIIAYDDNNRKITDVSGPCCIYWASNNTAGVPKGEQMNLASKAKPLQIVGSGPMISRITVTLGEASQYTPAEFNE